MKKEFRVIVDKYRNGEDCIRDELTVCRWGEARDGGNCLLIITSTNLSIFIYLLQTCICYIFLFSV
jgi:hypothetical protein